MPIIPVTQEAKKIGGSKFKVGPRHKCETLSGKKIKKSKKG
jgi:hypothetical protein